VENLNRAKNGPAKAVARRSMTSKKNIECPKCGAAFVPEPPAKPQRPVQARKMLERLIEIESVGP